MTTSALGGRRQERSTIIAWTLCAFVILVATVGIVYGWMMRPADQPVDRIIWGWGWLLPATFAVLAALIVARQPYNRVGWLLMVTALAAAVSNSGYSDFLAAPRTELTPGLFLLLWFDGWAWILLIFPVFLIPLHFPTGRPPTPRWNWVNWLAVGMGGFFVVASLFFDNAIGPMDYAWRLPNPLGYIPEAVVNGPFLLGWGSGLVIVLGASLVSLIVRYRRAHAIERLQIRWLIFAGVILLLTYTPIFFLTDPAAPGFASQFWQSLLLLVSIMGFAAAITIAILRYQLWDIDVIIRRTLIYSVLTAILALVYFGSVIVLQTIFADATGERSALSIVLSTLLIAALFTPLRLRIQETIDRRFFRRKYDAQQALAGFSRLTRGAADLDEINRALLQVVDETVQPQTAAVWLRPEKK